MLATIIWTAINASLIPFTFENLDKGREKEINSVVVPIIIIYSIMCFGVTIIAPEVIRILAPEEYFEGIYAVPPIAATAFIMALYNLYANVEFYHKRSWWIAFSTIVAALINVLLNYLLIPRFGYVGASYTTLISNVILIVLHYLGYRIAHKKRIYNDYVLGVILLSTIGLCLLCNLLYLNNVIRYIIIGIIVIGLLISIKPLLLLIKKIKKDQDESEKELLEGDKNE